MMFIKGVRKARIKKYVDHSHACPACKDFDLTVKVYNDYYHFFFIPIMPCGVKSTVIHCNQCLKLVRWDSLARDYEHKTRNPFYLYSLFFLLGLFIVAMIFARMSGDRERAAILADPRVGDVFELKTGAPEAYYFARVSRVSGDSLIVLHSALQYDRAVYELAIDDYFDARDSLLFMKAVWREMYNKDSIVYLSREHPDGAGFTRIR